MLKNIPLLDFFLAFFKTPQHCFSACGCVHGTWVLKKRGHKMLRSCFEENIKSPRSPRVLVLGFYAKLIDADVDYYVNQSKSFTVSLGKWRNRSYHLEPAHLQTTSLSSCSIQSPEMVGPTRLQKLRNDDSGRALVDSDLGRFQWRKVDWMDSWTNDNDIHDKSWQLFSCFFRIFNTFEAPRRWPADRRWRSLGSWDRIARPRADIPRHATSTGPKAPLPIHSLHSFHPPTS